MSRLDASIELMFGGDERRFRLTIDQLFALEERRAAPVAVIHQRLASEKWYVADVQEVLRLGLIGAGVAAHEAKLLVERHAGETQLGPASLVALYVMTAALVPPRGMTPAAGDIAAGKSSADGDLSEATAASPLPPVMAPESSSD